MRALWTNKTGFAKWMTLFATALLISLGLCGANFGTFFLGTRFLPAQPRDTATVVLIITAYIEAAAIIISASGLIVTGFAWLLTAVVSKMSRQK